MFIKDRFADLAKTNEEALKNQDSDAVLKRVAPANIVAATGSEWNGLSEEDKKKYEERYVLPLAMEPTTAAATILIMSFVLRPQCQAGSASL